MDGKYCAYSLGVRFVARLLPSRNIFIVKQDCIMKKWGEIDIYFPFDWRSGNALYVFHKSGWKIRQNLLFMRESLCCDKNKDRILTLAVNDISFKLYIFIRCKIITSAWKYMFMYTYVYVYSVIAEKKMKLVIFQIWFITEKLWKVIEICWINENIFWPGITQDLLM